MDFFKVIPENFFSLLASKNKRIYLSLIVEAFKIYENGSILGIEKKIVVDELVHYLDTNKYEYESEDEDDEEANAQSKRDLANYVLRRMEECGWIYIDVTHDYEEVLNFSDAGITIVEAIISMAPNYLYGEEDGEFVQKSEYQGYVYTIYSLLNNSDNIEYSVILQEVYRNTKLLIRSIRKLDARLKDYISSVFNQTDVKDLMENLVSYRQDFVENGYAKLKMSDNINRYRLRIVNRLTEYQNDSIIMGALTYNYPNLDKEKALQRANRDIDEIIDVFNALNDYITAIDEKSKEYINSTIAKIKFLVSEDDNIIGKLNHILKQIRIANQENHLDKTLRLVNQKINLVERKRIGEGSLYVPRGNYKRNYNMLLDDGRLFDFDIEADFFDAYQAPYQEDLVKDYLSINLVDNRLYGGDVIRHAKDMNETMMAIYAILFALENEEEYEVLVLDDKVKNSYIQMRDFIIRKRDDVDA